MIVKKCIICGADFETENERKLMCSEICMKIRHNENVKKRKAINSEIRANRLAEEKRLKKQQSNKRRMDLAFIANEAKRCGLSYGVYVGMKGV